MTLPIGTIVPYAGASAPDEYLLCYGQAISRTDYAGLFTVISTTYGSGDGSTTFNIPDLRGRVVAGQDDMGGTSANRLTGQSGGVDGDGLGNAGGLETHTLITAELASHTHDGSGLTASSAGAHTHQVPQKANGFDPDGGGVVTGVSHNGTDVTTSSDGAHTHSISGTTGSAGSGNPHNNVQPTLILNYLIYTGPELANYVTEDGVDNYVSEDETNNYVTEN